MKAKLVSLDEAVRTVVLRYGGVRAAARATGVDKSFISRLMNGRKVAPSAQTLEALGLRAVPLYEVLPINAFPVYCAAPTGAAPNDTQRLEGLEPFPISTYYACAQA